MTDQIGPALPPHLQKLRESQAPDQKSDDEEDQQIGPALPPHLQKARTQAEKGDDSDDDDGPVGPRLPEVPCRGPEPGSGIGPSLPPGMSSKGSSIGPAIPSSMSSSKEQDDDSDDDVIGPMPPKPGTSDTSSVVRDFEARAQRMKDKLEGKGEEVQQRETWMLELPPEMTKNFGLGPRQFSRKSGSEPKSKDRSAWTDTPADRERRARGEIVETEGKDDDRDVLEYMASLKRDEEMEKVTQELKKKRGSESLMDMHSKKIKKKEKEAEKSGGKKERRPFDRDVDLQANRFDNAQKELMLKKARQLDDRFSRGGSKFL